MSSIKRQHTIHSCVREGGSIVGVLEKDWFDANWCSLFEHHFRVLRVNHLFHVTSQIAWFSQAHAENMVDATMRGCFRTIDFREFSATHYPSRQQRKRK